MEPSVAIPIVLVGAVAIFIAGLLVWRRRRGKAALPSFTHPTPAAFEPQAGAADPEVQGGGEAQGAPGGAEVAEAQADRVSDVRVQQHESTSGGLSDSNADRREASHDDRAKTPPPPTPPAPAPPPLPVQQMPVQQDAAAPPPVRDLDGTPETAPPPPPRHASVSPPPQPQPALQPPEERRPKKNQPVTMTIALPKKRVPEPVPTPPPDCPPSLPDRLELPQPQRIRQSDPSPPPQPLRPATPPRVSDAAADPPPLPPQQPQPLQPLQPPQPQPQPQERRLQTPTKAVGGLPPLAPGSAVASPLPPKAAAARDSPMRRPPPTSPFGGSVRSSGSHALRGCASPFRALSGSQGSQLGSVWSGASCGARWGASVPGSRSGSVGGSDRPQASPGWGPLPPRPAAPPPAQPGVAHALWSDAPVRVAPPSFATPAAPPHNASPPVAAQPPAIPHRAPPPAVSHRAPPAVPHHTAHARLPTSAVAPPTPLPGVGRGQPRPAFHDPAPKPGAVVQNMPPPPVLLSDGTLSRAPGSAPGMGAVLRRNPFHFADMYQDWARRAGRDRDHVPPPAPPIEWGPMPDTNFADVPAAEWAALDEANRVREGISANHPQGSTYWSAFLAEMHRLQT